MQALWNIENNTLALWAELIAANRNKELPVRRRKMNVRRIDINLSKEEVWRVLVGCQVTTQQHSGPKSAVSRFLKSDSFALSVRHCRQSDSLSGLLESEFAGAGLRRGLTIARNLERILFYLESGGGWNVLLRQLRTLVTKTSMNKERAVVSYLLSDKYPGLGQKQSRNFIQWLGLSRHEIPLDSRILKKLREFGATFIPTGTALTDEAVYLFVQSCLQEVAKSLKVYPCELDACIFASYDINDDTEMDAI